MKKLTLVLFALFLVVATAFVFVSRNKTSTELEAGSSQGVHYIQIRGALDANGVRKFSKLLKRIEETDTESVILVIDSPGGELSAGFNLSDRILESEMKTYCLVHEGMATALYAVASSDAIYFTKEGAVGSAEVILGNSNPELNRIKDELSALIRDQFEKISSQTGTKVDLLRAMTDANLELIRDGEVITKKGELLSLNPKKAIQLGFSSGTVDSIDELAMTINKSDNQSVVTTPDAARPTS